MLVIISNMEAEEQGGGEPRSYVARLVRGQHGKIERQLVTRDAGDAGGFYEFRGQPRPGDVFEVRRWGWDAEHTRLLAATIYIGFDAVGRGIVLSREEALFSVLHPNAG